MKPKDVFHLLTPPSNWIFPVIVILGITAGLSTYIIYISKAPSYLSDQPETCVNCHIMAPQYATWSHSSHREVTNCNDCHVPHDNVLNHYYFKAKDGMRHATIFTLRLEPQVIFIHEAGQKVVYQNCIRCHEPLLKNPKFTTLFPEMATRHEQGPCWDCHRETPHGRVNSLSSVPHAKVPLPSSPVPEWIKNLSK